MSSIKGGMNCKTETLAKMRCGGKGLAEHKKVFFKLFKRKKAKRKTRSDSQTATFWVVFLMSVSSFTLLIFSIAGNQLIGFPLLLGLFGALLCLLSISDRADKRFAILGIVLGLFGGVGSFIRILLKRDLEIYTK